MEKVKTIDFKKWVGYVAIFVGCYGLFTFSKKQENQRKIDSDKRKTIVCPSLLSIGRSSRDTMIIMKNEPVCNDFVLENLR